MAYKLDDIAKADLPAGKLLFNQPASPQEPLSENSYAVYNHVMTKDFEEMFNGS